MPWLCSNLLSSTLQLLYPRGKHFWTNRFLCKERNNVSIWKVWLIFLLLFLNWHMHFGCSSKLGVFMNVHNSVLGTELFRCKRFPQTQKITTRELFPWLAYGQHAASGPSNTVHNFVLFSTSIFFPQVGKQSEGKGQIQSHCKTGVPGDPGQDPATTTMVQVSMANIVYIRCVQHERKKKKICKQGG